MKIQKFIFVIALLLFVHVSAYSQLEKYMAAFTYQFCKSIKWTNSPSVFVIGVVGNSAVTPHFQQMSKEKKIGSSSISIVEWSSADEIETCHVLFIPKEQTSRLSVILGKTAGKPILIITESSGAVKNGAGISFVMEDGKIRFELNKTVITKNGLTVPDDLARMALKVL